VFFFACSTKGGNIWNSIPGATNTTKMNNLVAGVLLARQWLVGRLCVHQSFIQPPAPTDNSTVINWAAFLCGYWGGPANTTDLCTYYAGGGRTQPSNIVASNFPGVYGALRTTYEPSGNSLLEYETVRDALSFAIAAVTQTPSFAATAQADFDANLKTQILSSNTTIVNNPCPTPMIINWGLPTALGNINVPLDTFVTWVWNDALNHSVQSTTSGFTFLGIGGQGLATTKSFDCATGYTPNGACVVDSVGVFNYTYQFTVPGQVVNFDCVIHGSQMAGSITVATLNTTGQTTSNSGNPTTGFDGTGITTASASVGSSSASTLNSWLFW